MEALDAEAQATQERSASVADVAEAAMAALPRATQADVAVGIESALAESRSGAIFLTLAEETELSPIILCPAVFEERRLEMRVPVLAVLGRVSRRQG